MSKQTLSVEVRESLIAQHIKAGYSRELAEKLSDDCMRRHTAAKAREESTPLHWTRSASERGLEVCDLSYQGRRYCLYRDASLAIVKVYKRERTNRLGAYYQPLAIRGKAAQGVIAAASRRPAK